MRWNLLQLPEVSLTTDNVVEWRRNIGGADVTHRVDFSISAGSTAALVPLVVRVYSYWLIDQIPDSGLFETLSKLKQIRDYHLELAEAAATEQRPQKVVLRAKPGKRYDRPVISLPTNGEEQE